MNFEDLEKTWARQTVAGAPASADRIRQTLVQEVRQRSRRIRRIIGVVTFMFVIGWGVSLAAHFTGIKPFNAVTLATTLVTSCFDVAFFILAFRSLQRMKREAVRMGESLLDSVRGSLHAVDWQIRDCLLLSYGLGASFALSVVAFIVKYFSGNLPARGVLVGIVFGLIFAAAVIATLRRYYIRDLIPRREDLRQQMLALEA